MFERQAFYDNLQDSVMKTMPQIFINGKRIGGYTELLEVDLGSNYTMMDPSPTFKPFRYPWAFTMARKHTSTHWVEDEVPLGDDVADWKGNVLSVKEKDFIINILRLFTQSDLAVSSNYYDYLLPHIKNNEIRMMLGSFADIESIHMRAYSLLNETLGLPDSDYHAFLSYKEMTDKAIFIQDSNPNTKKGFGLTLAKNVFSEGVMLFASFAMLLNFSRFGKMRGMSTIVEFSIRDEDQHASGLAKVHCEYVKENPRIFTDEYKKHVYDMARETVMLEDAFVDMTFDIFEPEGMTREDTKQYLRFMTDRRLLDMGFKEVYGVENPFDWIDQIVGGQLHTNFFEEKVSSYSNGGLKGDFSYNFLNTKI
jgi:ribonucleotide reductase beta subunit family protein with ferritin-like domain